MEGKGGTMSTPTARREIVIEEIRETGPIRTSEALRRLSGTMDRLDVMRALSDAEDTGELVLGLRGHQVPRDRRPA